MEITWWCCFSRNWHCISMPKFYHLTVFLLSFNAVIFFLIGIYNFKVNSVLKGWSAFMLVSSFYEQRVDSPGASLTIQWLSLQASTAGDLSWVWSLVGELRSQMSHGAVSDKKRKSWLSWAIYSISKLSSDNITSNQSWSAELLTFPPLPPSSTPRSL